MSGVEIVLAGTGVVALALFGIVVWMHRRIAELTSEASAAEVRTSAALDRAARKQRTLVEVMDEKLTERFRHDVVVESQGREIARLKGRVADSQVAVGLALTKYGEVLAELEREREVSSGLDVLAGVRVAVADAQGMSDRAVAAAALAATSGGAR